MRLTFHAILIATGLGLAGCAGPAVPNGANPYPPVPAAIADVVPQPPVSQDPLVWRPGHWDWTGSGYAWSNGQWVPAAGHGANWMDGYWTNARGDWTWTPGRWL